MSSFAIRSSPWSLQHYHVANKITAPPHPRHRVAKVWSTVTESAKYSMSLAGLGAPFWKMSSESFISETTPSKRVSSLLETHSWRFLGHQNLHFIYEPFQVGEHLLPSTPTPRWLSWFWRGGGNLTPIIISSTLRGFKTCCPFSTHKVVNGPFIITATRHPCSHLLLHSGDLFGEK